MHARTHALTHTPYVCMYLSSTPHRRRRAVLEDPLFLQHHVWLGLEKERLELLLAHAKAQRQR